MQKGYYCATCGKYHEGLPMCWGYDAPYYWNPEFAEKNPLKNKLTSDTCIINGKAFIRGIIEIPVVDSENKFCWSVWVSVNEVNFKRYKIMYNSEKMLQKEPYFGYLCNKLSGYPDTLSLDVSIVLQEVGKPPQVVLDYSNSHPLCQEQYKGITMQRVREIINRCSPGEYFTKMVFVAKDNFIAATVLCLLIFTIISPSDRSSSFYESLEGMLTGGAFLIATVGFLWLLFYLTTQLETTEDKKLVYKSLGFYWKKTVKIEDIIACYFIPMMKWPNIVFSSMHVVHIDNKNQIKKMEISIINFKLKDVVDTLKGLIAVKPQIEFDDYGESFVNGKYFEKNKKWWKKK